MKQSPVPSCHSCPAILSHIHIPKMFRHPPACFHPKISCPLAISHMKLSGPHGCHSYPGYPVPSLHIFLRCPGSHAHLHAFIKISCPLTISYMKLSYSCPVHAAPISAILSHFHIPKLSCHTYACLHPKLS
jgi:hypothetical protein